ncbi:MAG: hypothetical protein ACOX4I_00395 [Anaerovoracaceae bacterium]|jgi:hypothetical protein
MYSYYLAYDDGNIVIRDKLGAPIQRYDKNIEDCVTDWNMSGIYSGDVPAKIITEEEAMRRINNL